MKNVKLIESMVTWQGEGPDAGKRMLLCRFKKCNRGDKLTLPYLSPCSYCDTLVKMRSSVETSYDLNELQKIITQEKLGLLITGGEPTFSYNLEMTIQMIEHLDIPGSINIETNGYQLFKLLSMFEPVGDKVKIMYSPKFFNMNEVKLELKKIEDNLDLISSIIYFKLVYNEKTKMLNDYFLTNILYGYKINNNNVYLMPEGKDKKGIIKNSEIVFDKCEEFKVNFSSRDHIIYSFI